jgi:hypothetical protein
MSAIDVQNINSKTGNSAITISDAGATTVNTFTSTGIDDNASSTAITIDSSQNVGFGVAPNANSRVYVRTAAATDVAYLADNSVNSGFKVKFDSGSTAILNDFNAPLIFGTNDTERMRLDASGSLLHGTTSSSIYNATTGNGVNIKGQQGQIIVAKDATSTFDPALWLNNTGVDGAIAVFSKDGSTFATIGNHTNKTEITGSGSNTVTIGHAQSTTLGAGFYFWHTNNAIVPYNSAGHTIPDNVQDLGHSSYRWDDIYATNGTIQTSDANEKQDIEALSEAETRVAVAAKALLRKFRWKSALEEKGDEARVHFGIIAQDLKAAFEAEGLDAGRYAMFIHSTWTDEETGEERSRMGVRYSELLAFIIAAI